MIPLFFISYGVVGNAIGHAGFCIAAHGYFPGMWTAFAHAVLAPVLLHRMWSWRRDVARADAGQRSHPAP
jgi:hypothetical protein